MGEKYPFTCIVGERVRGYLAGMKNEYGNIRPGRGKVLLWVDVDQREYQDVKLGDVEIVVRGGYGTNMNEKDPCVGETLDGTRVLCHHHAFNMKTRGEGMEGSVYRVGDTGERREDGAWLFSVSEDMVHGSIREGKFCAAEGWVSVGRVKRVHEFGVEEVPTNLWREVESGKVLITYKNAGIRVEWTLDGKMGEAWKVRERDVLGEYTGKEYV